MTEREKKELAAAVYSDALKKLAWNMQRGNDERVDEWATLAGHLEHLYGLKRPDNLR